MTRFVLALACLVAGSCAPLATGPFLPEPVKPATLSQEGTLQLENSAYRDNVLMRFQDSEARYREAVLRSGAGSAESDVLQAENELYFALNKSNVGEHELAERLFAAPRALIAQHGTIVSKVKSDALYGQHLLNSRDAAGARKAAEHGIEIGTPALRGEAAAGTQAAERVVAQNVEVTPQVAALLGTSDRSELGQDLALGRLSENERLAVFLAQSHYVAAAAALEGAGGDASAHLEDAHKLLSGVPPRTALWLRAEIARLASIADETAGRTEKAERDAAEAVRITRQFAANERPEARARVQRGKLQLELGQTSSARASFHRALEVLARGGSGIDYEDLAPYLGLLAADPQSSSRDAEAFLTLQQLRNPVTSETLARLAARLTAGSSGVAVAIRAFQDSQREVSRLEARLDALSASAYRDVHEVSIARSQLTAARESEVAAREAVVKEAPNYDQIVDRSVSLDDFRAALRPGELFLQVRLGKTASTLVAVSADRFALAQLDFSAGAAQALVSRIRDSIYSANFDVAAARELYVKLLGPVDDMVKSGTSIIFAPDGPLLSLPAGILVTEDPTGWAPGSADYTSVAWLAKQKPVTITLSASSFYQLRKTPSSDAQVAFHGYGNFLPASVAQANVIAHQPNVPPECVSTLEQLATIPPLPGTGVEIERIAHVLGAGQDALTTGAAFSDSALLGADLSNTRVLHFATHGLLPVSDACLPEPALVTSFGGAGSDALLEAGDVVSLKLNADLVVLSACDTGGHGATSAIGTGLRAAGGEALSGLVRAFFYAGARNVVASHWLVPDAETVTLMETLYGGLAGGKTLSEAMLAANAQLAANPATSHPFYWAAFSVIGDGARSMQFAS